MESWLNDVLVSVESGSLLPDPEDVVGAGCEPPAPLLPAPSDQLQYSFSLPLDLLYEEVTAYRCRLCQVLEATQLAIANHIEENHCQPETNTPSSPPGQSHPTPPTPPPSAPSTTKQTPEADKQLYLCSECGHISETLLDCKIHMKKVHLLNKPKSDEKKQPSAEADSRVETPAQQDSKEAKKKRERRPPQKLRHEKRVVCGFEKCTLRFTCEANKQIHEKCHETAKLFRCSECSQFSCTTWVRMMTHMWRQHQIDLDLFTCDKCGFKSSVFSNLENHRNLHVSERRFVCTECNKGFRQLPQLLNHRVIHADRSKVPVPKWFRPHLCTTCHKMFSSVKSLKIHQKILHDKVRSFCCKVCSHTASTKALLQVHMRGHSGETPFVCTEPKCQFKTRDPSSFRKHKMRHTGRRPYKCPHCSHECIQSAAIKSHIIQHHNGEGIFRCHLCNFCTVNEVTYGMHVSDHQNGLIATREDSGDEEASSDRVLASCVEQLTELPLLPPGGDIRNEYVFTIAPDAPAEDRGGISIPAGEEDRHLVNGIIDAPSVPGVLDLK